ncbi:transcriptional regulator [Thermococcus chitonophagus]|uniref:Transcription regulator, ArsR family n=1 Tax=Thermococcus chitonophagus TaxID=54262 RepID=A0A160VTM5_9EURY|nr:metalloregulator ArsR/SmtB family transcription factor [Thermococcus chitonophagus]ASJ15723.1 transcriptional regulator [Thermococcus chitonophagus]CUX76941.1 Transcription regulator, ArsR family [Thermococcus chitonophagus]
MKVRELIEKLSDRQRKTVMGCLERCNLLDLDEEIEVYPSDDVNRFLKIISNPIRYGILKMLMDRWMCVCLIAEALEVDQTLVSHHLRILKELGILEEKKEGKLRFYTTNKEKLREYLDALLEDLGYESPKGS